MQMWSTIEAKFQYFYHSSTSGARKDIFFYSPCGAIAVCQSAN